MQRFSKNTVMASVITGLSLGLLLVGFVWEHNASCSIHCGNFINWSALMGYMAMGSFTTGGAFFLIVNR